MITKEKAKGTPGVLMTFPPLRMSVNDLKQIFNGNFEKKRALLFPFMIHNFGELKLGLRIFQNFDGGKFLNEGLITEVDLGTVKNSSHWANFKKKYTKEEPPLVIELEKSKVTRTPVKTESIILNHLWLSGEDVEKIIKNTKEAYIYFLPFHKKINPVCVSYSVSGIEANPCPPTPPPDDNISTGS